MSTREILLAQRKAAVAALAAQAGITPDGQPLPAAPAPVAAPAAPVPAPAPMVPPPSLTQTAAPAPVVAPAPVAAPAPVDMDDFGVPRVVPRPAPLVQAPAPAPVVPPAPSIDMSAFVQQAEQLASVRLAHEAAQAELAQLRANQSAAAARAAPRTAQDVLTKDAWKSDTVDYDQGVDLLSNLADPMAQMMEGRLKTLIDQQVAQATAATQAELKALRDREIAQRQTTFESAVTARVPHVREMLEDPRFKLFLNEEIPGAAIPFVDAYNKHIAGQNADGIAWVANQFAAFTNRAAPGAFTEAPRVASHVVPQTEAPAGGAPVRQEEFTQLRDQFRRREISQAEYSAQVESLRKRAFG